MADFFSHGFPPRLQKPGSYCLAERCYLIQAIFIYNRLYQQAFLLMSLQAGEKKTTLKNAFHRHDEHAGLEQILDDMRH